MQPYNGYFIEDAALLVHPFSLDWCVGGSVLRPGRLGSIVEVTRFVLPSFTMSMKEFAVHFRENNAKIDNLRRQLFIVWKSERR